MTLHPSSPDQIAMRYTADIETHDGSWFKYRVKRLHGIGIPEKCFTHHRTLKSARKAAERWCRKNEKTDGEVVERHGRLFSDDAVPCGVMTVDNQTDSEDSISLKHDDKLFVKVDKPIDNEMAERIRSQVKEALPGVRVLVGHGVELEVVESDDKAA